MSQTQWGYVIQCRVQGPQDTWAEPEGTVSSHVPVEELALQELVLSDFLTHRDARDNGWSRDNTVITRFAWTELSPVPVPDVSAERDTPGPDEQV